MYLQITNLILQFFKILLNIMECLHPKYKLLLIMLITIFNKLELMKIINLYGFILNL